MRVEDNPPRHRSQGCHHRGREDLLPSMEVIDRAAVAMRRDPVRSCRVPFRSRSPASSPLRGFLPAGDFPRGDAPIPSGICCPLSPAKL